MEDVKNVKEEGCGRKIGDFRCCSVVCGDCLELMARLPAGCVDAVITDPPYAEIDRDYGRLTETEWHRLMDETVLYCRRLLLPDGSAVFILQPNSEYVGRIRPWLFEFMAKWAREWNMPQDAWWWNTTAPPTVHTQRINGLMRCSVKACVWLGDSKCFRSQDSVLWRQSDANLAISREDRCLQHFPSGLTMRKGRCAAAADERGGVTPFNLLPISNANSTDSGGALGHGAATPEDVMSWWASYISREMILDPFLGSGTTAVAALKLGRHFLGFEISEEYCRIARERIALVEAQPRLFDAPQPEQLTLG